MKIINFLILSIIIYSGVYAQDSTLKIGVQIGANYSKLSGGDYYDLSSYGDIGFNAGIYWNYMINPSSYLNIEFWYINKGTRWGCSTIDYTCDGDYIHYDVSYIELPVYYTISLAHYSKEHKLLNVQLGVYLAYAISKSSKISFEVPPISIESGLADADDLIRSFDYGISIGLQLYHHKLHNAFIRILYDLSLSSFFNDDNILVKELSNRNMGAIVIFLGAEF